MKRPILYILIPFILGIVIAHSSNFQPFLALVVCIIALTLAAIYAGKNFFSHAALYLAVFFFGIFYSQNFGTLPGDHISSFLRSSPRHIFLKGVVADDPQASLTPYHKTKVRFLLNADAIKESDDWRHARGLVDVNLYASLREPLRYGRHIVLEGMIARPVGLKNPGLFDYANYLAIKDVYAVLRVNEGGMVEATDEAAPNPVKSTAYRIRSWMRTALDTYFKEPYRGFIKATMIGERADLRYSLSSDFIKTGTIHAIAISGLNVGLIAGMFLALLAAVRVPQKVRLVLVAIAMVLYIFIAGASPPIVRAVIIYIVVVAGYCIDRQSDMLNSLALAAFGMLLANPKALYDPSFQLSFISIASMILFVPKINSMTGIDAIERDSFTGKASYYIASGISVSVAAWAGTWPVVAHYFNIVSPVSLLANLVVVPALFVLTAGSFLFLAAGAVSVAAAAVAAHTVTLISAALFTANHWFAAAPLAYFRVASPSVIITALYYAAIALMLVPAKIEFKRFTFRRVHAIIAILIIANAIVWHRVASENNSTMRITFLDVGQGDSALIELPGGRNILVDAGSGGDEEQFDSGRAVVAPYLWNRGIVRLDAIIVSHFHEDHLGGIIYMLENFKVGAVLDSGAYCPKSDIYRRYRAVIKDRGIRHIAIREGDRIDFAHGRIIVMNPEKRKDIVDGNENSVVLKVVYNNFSALLCGDASGSALERMTDLYGKQLHADVIKVPHHGGNIGDEIIVKNFFDNVGARYAIISVAMMNKYKAPSPKTMRIISSSNPIIYTTKDNGAVTAYVTLKTYGVKTYIQEN